MIASEPKKADWLAAKSMYVENHTLSYADIARIFGVSHRQVKRHGVAEEWTQCRHSVTVSAENKIYERVADDRVAINDKHLVMYRNAQALINQYIKIIHENLKTVQVKAEAEGREVSIKELYHSQELYHLVQAMKVAIEGERTAVGLPTKVIAVRGTESEQSTPAFMPVDVNRLYELMEQASSH